MNRSKAIGSAAAAIVAIGAGHAAFSQLTGGAGDMSRLPSTNINLGATPVPDTSATCGTDPGPARLICLIDLLKSGVSAEVLANLQLDYSVAAARKWSNLPAGGYPDRPGALLGEFTEDQRGLVKAILQEATGIAAHEGYDELEEVLNADAIPTTHDGISVADLSPDQQALVLAAIETYAGDISGGEAATIMAKYTAELPQTSIGFSGTTALDTENDYVRIDGPSLWLEFSMQSNKSTGAAGNHPHSVWRDKISDYGGNTE
ncbi:DUF3500 domain-containing protein [Tabrizicola sp.]|uniref:DUF3500 domain-containing protein n=1 Tax=Tabrizicola sp. TaxID=2005166 RepID=UPI00286B8B0C|nr:DUF3500 domain-containing protein [Tabrizicola sp.]